MTEIEFYGQDPAKAQRIYTEALQLILQGLTQKSVDFHGEFFSYSNVPMELEPLQKPHPPIWYGVHSTESAERAAIQGLNMVSLDSARDTGGYHDKYREVWRAARGSTPTPKLGLSRFIVIAANDDAALSAARRAYPIWHRHFYFLYSLRGGKPAHPRPAEFDQMMAAGQAVAGSANTVTSFLQAQLAESKANYLVGQFAFGDLSLAESTRSVDIFAREVMPALRANE